MAEQVGRIGQQIGHYRLIKLLGQGGFAEVYLGEHRYLGTQAAVKFVHARLAGGRDICVSWASVVCPIRG